MRLDAFEQTTNDLKYMVMDEYCSWGTFKENVKNCDGSFEELNNEIKRISAIKDELSYHKELRRLMNKYI